MNTNDLNLITEKLGAITQDAIAQYTHWHFINAVVWFSLGALLLITAIIGMRYGLKHDFSVQTDREFLIAMFGLLLIVSVVLLADNVVNIVQPRAYSIHQLISDVKP